MPHVLFPRQSAVLNAISTTHVHAVYKYLAASTIAHCSMTNRIRNCQIDSQVLEILQKRSSSTFFTLFACYRVPAVQQNYQALFSAASVLRLDVSHKISNNLRQFHKDRESMVNSNEHMR